MVKFSIIIPVYNVENYIRKCLDSVVNQTYQNFEVILVCDISSDKSEEIADEYIKKYKNFKKLNVERVGLSVSRNVGIKEAKGKYLLLLDSDDFIEEKLLEILNDEFSKDDKLEIIRFQIQEVKGDVITKFNEEPFDVTDGISAFQKIVRYHYVENAWAYAYKTSFFKKNKFEFVKGCISEDYGLTPLVIAKAKYVKSIPYIGYNYVQRANSIMSDTDYSKKVKKMDDMFLQAGLLKREFKNIGNNDTFMRFINNSLIYYSTTLKKQDYKKYKKRLKSENCFDFLPTDNLKHKIKGMIIKMSPWIFHHYIAR